MDRLATKIGEVGDGGLKVYLGNYSRYREGAVGAGSASTGLPEPVATGKGRTKKQAVNPIEAELDALEAEIDRLSERRVDLEEALSQPERYESREALEALTAEYQQLDEAIGSAEARWEELSSQLLVSA
jgi:ATP-binding cassette subfamily F protein 3